MENKNQSEETWYCVLLPDLGLYDNCRMYFPTNLRAIAKFQSKIEDYLSRYRTEEDVNKLMKLSVREANAVVNSEGNVEWELGAVVYTALEAIKDIKKQALAEERKLPLTQKPSGMISGGIMLCTEEVK